MNVEERINELEKKIDSNMDKIIKNMNRLHKHEEKINNNTEKIKNNSYALSILKDYKTGKSRLFTILIIVLFMWFATIGYLVYVLNDIGVEEVTTETSTQEINDVDSIENSNIVNGDNYGEDKTDKN